MNEDLKNLGKQLLQKLSFSIKKNEAGYEAEANVDEANVTVKKESDKPVNFTVNYKQGKGGETVE